jgi:hypothetical protein
VSSSTDGWLLFYDVTKRTRLREIHLAPILAFSLSHDSLYVACGTAAGELMLLDLRRADDAPVWAVQARAVADGERARRASAAGVWRGGRQGFVGKMREE